MECEECAQAIAAAAARVLLIIAVIMTMTTGQVRCQWLPFINIAQPMLWTDQHSVGLIPRMSSLLVVVVVVVVVVVLITLIVFKCPPNGAL